MNQALRVLEALLALSMAQIAILKDRLAQAENDAAQDGLTGLANRRHFDLTLQNAIRVADERAVPLSILIIDIDHFKKLNDTHGHLLGDSVLRLMAGLMRDQIRASDLVARYGGEEFAIILPGATLAVGLRIAEQIRQVVAQRTFVDRSAERRVMGVTCSIGVAQYRPGETMGDLVDRADLAMYRAKQSGRDQVAMETPPD